MSLWRKESSTMTEQPLRCPYCKPYEPGKGQVRVKYNNGQYFIEHLEHVYHDIPPCKAPTREECVRLWNLWVGAVWESIHMENGPMIWDGTNTDEVVKWCCAWMPDLCHITNITHHTNITYHTVTGRLALVIEPADIMRKSDLYIPVGAILMRCENQYNRFIKVFP